jgi:hypothetical protein
MIAAGLFMQRFFPTFKFFVRIKPFEEIQFVFISA